MSKAQAKQQPSPYILGHTDAEMKRLMAQANFLGELTEKALQQAGLKPGMRVLDIGCGPGDVSFLAASLVGSEGEVIGVDKSEEVVALAKQRANAAGLDHVQFMAQDVDELRLDAPVDALIGRLVLMYFPDPAATLRALLSLVKPGGLVMFQEIDAEGTRSEPRCDVFETAVERIRQTLSRAGADNRSGLKLGQIFEDAGLPTPQMVQRARVERGSYSLLYAQVEGMSRTLLPLMKKLGVATAAEVDVDTLASRLREEAVSKNATLIFPPLIAAWAQKAVED